MFTFESVGKQFFGGLIRLKVRVRVCLEYCKTTKLLLIIIFSHSLKMALYNFLSYALVLKACKWTVICKIHGVPL